MKTDIKIREPFSYSLIPIIVLGVIIIAVILYFIAPIIKSFLKKQKAKPKVVKAPKKNITAIKLQYLQRLNVIEYELVNQKITIRQAYINMSECIRAFVFEMTGINVQCYTLQEIHYVRMPLLEQIIAEYYYPEFAEQSVSDVIASINRTRGVVHIWK